MSQRKLERLDRVRERCREEALARGISPRDVDLLLSDLLERPLSYLIGHGEVKVDPAPLEALLRRRFAGEPLQYIRMRTEFFSREFYVDGRVLIPRPETEILVETALARAPANASVVDVGTGSGCIAISMERTRPDLRILGVDLSVDALAVAERNRRALDSRVRLAASDLLAAVNTHVDLIVSNPPYIAEQEIAGLAPEVRLFEPRVALTPGASGTEIIGRILDEAHPILAPNGLVIFEIGYGQQEAVRAVAEARRFAVEEIIPDLAGIDRVVVLSPHG